jgi:hypothetical protein
MPTDYILFIHGVKTRSAEEINGIANKMFRQISNCVARDSCNLQLIVPFWGDLNIEATNDLRAGLKRSSKWDEVWFRDFRSGLLMDFVGDAALYISRHVGSQVVQRLQQTAAAGIKTMQPGDRLHLITHSWGTVILFDILFAGRWEDPRLDAQTRASVELIRKALFGLPPDPERGIPLASIHTMGSPIALFSLLNVTGKSSHDLTPKLKELLASLHAITNRPLPWKNYVHPGDPISFPLEGVLPDLLDEEAGLIQVQDVICYQKDWVSWLTAPLRQTLVPMLGGGDAHQYYFKSDIVIKEISQTINQVVQSRP